MTTIKTVAAHQVVQRAFPREKTEQDELGMATGKAVDSALSHLSHQASRGRSVSSTALIKFAAEILDEELRDADLRVAPEKREAMIAEVGRVARAFRASPIYGLPRPRSRMILIGEQVGVYAQPDYWDTARRFYEMKSYRVDRLFPDVELQLRLFQLAFPGLEANLIWFDRHGDPVLSGTTVIPALAGEEVDRILGLAYETGVALGLDKVLEYIDVQVVRYPIPGPPPPS